MVRQEGCCEALLPVSVNIRTGSSCNPQAGGFGNIACVRLQIASSHVRYYARMNPRKFAGLALKPGKIVFRLPAPM
jgi:hypothetical protein